MRDRSTHGSLLGSLSMLTFVSGCGLATTSTSTYNPHSSTESVSIGGAVADAPPFEPKSAHFGIAQSFGFSGTAIDSPHHQVALTDFADSCGNSDVQGQILYIDLFQNPSAEQASVSEPAVFEVWVPNHDAALPTSNVAVATYSVNTPDGGQLWLAQSGNIKVTDVSAEQLSASVELTFDQGALAGSFSAPGCSDWLRSASVPTP